MVSLCRCLLVAFALMCSSRIILGTRKILSTRKQMDGKSGQRVDVSRGYYSQYTPLKNVQDKPPFCCCKDIPCAEDELAALRGKGLLVENVENRKWRSGAVRCCKIKNKRCVSGWMPKFTIKANLSDCARPVEESVEKVHLPNLATNGKEKSRRPSLGPRFESRFEVTRFLARGGQAEVWKGLDLEKDQSVVFRFPLGWCEAGRAPCKIAELDRIVLDEFRLHCALALQASERARVKARLVAKNRATHAHTEYYAHMFAECIMPLSNFSDDIAFEVWSFAGDVTLGEAFFMNTSVGLLSTEEKRKVLRELKESVATLSDATVQKQISSTLCCCSYDGRVEVCTARAQLSYRKERLLPHYRSCPRGQKNKPEKCGPLSHHDIKFDNVMLSWSASTNQLQPILVDFGSTVRCSDKNARHISPDWTPWWLADPFALSGSACWSYDAYGVGMIWLVTELLSGLPATKLVCDKAASAELIDEASINGKTFACSNEIVDMVWDNVRWRQGAFIPVHCFIRDISLYLRSWKGMYSIQSFEAALKNFRSSKASTCRGSTGGLHLTIPPKAILGEIFALLQECPSFPGVSVTDRQTERTLYCRFNLAQRRFHQAIAEKNQNMISWSVDALQTSCQDLRSFAFKKTKRNNTASGRHESWLAKLNDSCHDRDMKALMSIVYESNVSIVQDFILASKRLALHAFFPDGETVLAVAARTGHAPMVEMLLKLGADPLRVDRQKTTLLAGRLEAGGMPSATEIDVLPLTPLMAAATLPNNTDVLRLMLRDAQSRGVVLSSVHAFTNDSMVAGPSLLSFAAETGDVDMLKLVLGALKKSNQETFSSAVLGVGGGDVPLLKGAARGRADVCRELLRVRADPGAQDHLGRTPLMLAVQSGDLKTARVLSETSPKELSACTTDIGCPLHMASARGDASMVTLLLELGADIHRTATTLQESALHTACRHGLIAVPAIHALAKHNDAHFVTDRAGETPLALSARKCSDEGDVFRAVFELAPLKALKLMDGKGRIPQFSAALHGSIPCLRILMERMNADAPSVGGQTALMAAVSAGQGPTIKTLLEDYGANVSARDDAGHPVAFFVPRSTSEMQLMGRKSTLRELARAAGTNDIFQEFDSTGLTVLGHWITLGDLDMVKFLVAHMGISCNSTAAIGSELLYDRFVEHGLQTTNWPAVGAALTPLQIIRLQLAVRWFQKFLHRSEKFMDLQSFLESLSCDGRDSEHVKAVKHDQDHYDPRAITYIMPI